MNDLTVQMRWLLRIFCFWAAICLVLWIVFQDAQPYISGLLLGSAVSLLNAAHLAMKIHQISDAVMLNQKKRLSVGFVSRICFVLIAIMLASKLPQFSVLFTIIGFMFAPLTLLIHSIIRGLVNKKS